MNIIDLFSGCGGLTEGFRTKEFNMICHIEMDEDACNSLRTREVFQYMKEKNDLSLYNSYLLGNIKRDELYQTMPENLMDKVINCEISHETIDCLITQIMNLSNGKIIDGIIGGPPCQAYSTIGRARNEKIKGDDKRIYLYKYYSKFLKKFNPKFFIFENVKGLLSYKDEHNEKLLPKIINEFESTGYNISCKVINSIEYGVPQKRERLFIFGIRKDIEISPSDFFQEMEKERTSGINIRDLFADLPKMRHGEEKNYYVESNQISQFIIENLKSNDTPLTYNVSRFCNEKDREIYKLVVLAKKKGKNLKYNELPTHLKSHKNETNFLDRFKCLSNDEVAHTLVAHISKDGHHYIHPDISQNRSITVREAARIQTFPDDFYFESSRTAAYKQIGNAVPVVLSKKIAKSICKIFN
ncbi:DNA cytosine methyltransferase [Floricoccus penangensis]|uniref:DNA cytosine methyltransferase n=1 Tax=Floricoccus penangensis TaxID=1859475 RepID=UPI00203D13BD|nr:DNA cytosine methyltransferase [Floricoccus penangensis]URZ87567.1 DNA cytosine methyltransferase [Floricoccus penangensis]